MVNTAEMRTGLGDVSPRHPGVAPTVLSMLQSARRGLAEAADESAPGAITLAKAVLSNRVPTFGAL